MREPIRGKTRSIPNKVPSVNIPVHNRFDIEVMDSKTGKVRQRAQAENVILNAFWTRIFSGNDCFKYIHYGTGSGTPSVTDTQLFAFKSAVAVSGLTRFMNESCTVYSAQASITLNETAEVGTNFTEVGIGYSTAAASICTHAMLKDMNGNDISILKTNTDILTIYATIYLQLEGSFNSYFATSVQTSGNHIGILDWALGTYAYPNPGFSYVGPNASSAKSGGSANRNAETKTLTQTLTRLGASEDGKAGYCAIFEMWQPFYIFVTPDWYPGSVITGEAIGTGDGATVNFKTKYGHVKAGATIYVDGVASDATVDVGMPTYVTNPYYLLRRCNESGAIISLANQFVYNPETVVIYNPMHESIGITRITTSYVTDAWYSNDCVTWTKLTGVSNMDTAAIKNSKYWKFYNSNTGSSSSQGRFQFTIDYSGYNIHFDEPPAVGAVITADYVTDLIAKDTNHVLDGSIIFTFGEHTP